MKILILGANGMLGNACVNLLHLNKQLKVYGSIRSEDDLSFFKPEIRQNILTGISIEDEVIRDRLFKRLMPDVVINCVGIVKQALNSSDPIKSITLNSLLPHQLAKLCSAHGIRLIHISTDCVFSGKKGTPYLEVDPSDALDMYGRTKFLGEVDHAANILTIRTSYIGNELHGTNGLLEWFLVQEGRCQGFTRAIYTGMPTVILVKVIEELIINHPLLSGLYHVSSAPISKYNLLMLIAKVFGKEITIIPNDTLVIDRSLDGSRFKDKTGFIAPSWDEMVRLMYLDRIEHVQK